MMRVSYYRDLVEDDVQAIMAWMYNNFGFHPTRKQAIEFAIHTIRSYPIGASDKLASIITKHMKVSHYMVNKKATTNLRGLRKRMGTKGNHTLTTTVIIRARAQTLPDYDERAGHIDFRWDRSQTVRNVITNDSLTNKIDKILE